MSQGIMSEDDGTAIPVPPAVKKARPAKRRVASAPLPAAPAPPDATLITPSPSPSPNSKKKLERMVKVSHRSCWNRSDRSQSSSLKNAFNPGSVRNRPGGNLRTVSMMNSGYHDRYPGESTLQFYPPPDPNRFKPSPTAKEDSQKTMVDGGVCPGKVEEIFAV